MPDSEITKQTFKRSQVEWALWRVHRRSGQRREEPTARFRTRIKRLLEIDRAKPHWEWQEVSGPEYAFSDESTEGRGKDVGFTAFDAFCLTIGLDLLNLGLPQTDTVFLLRNYREALRTKFHGSLVTGPPRHTRERLSPKDYPDLPTYKEGDTEWADPTVFSLIRKVELTETLPGTARPTTSDIPVFLEPIICDGSADLARKLRELQFRGRSCLILEIGYSGTAVIAWLRRAPLKTRGPS